MTEPEGFTPRDQPDGGMTRSSVVLVTGATGFVGGRMVTHLRTLGHTVRTTDIREPSGKHYQESDFVLADLTSITDASRVCEGITHVFHFAGNPNGTVSVTHPAWDFQTNAVASTNIFASAIEHGASRVVYISSGMVYGVPQTSPIPETHVVDPFIPYAASKLSGELSALAAQRTYGLDVRIARPFTLYGPGEDHRTSGGEVGQYLRWHLNSRPIPVVGDPYVKSRDFTHVDDAIRALITIMQHGTAGESYNVGTGTETSLNDLINLIGTLSKTQPRSQIDEHSSADTYRHVADISKLRSLGYQPRVPLRDGVFELLHELGSRPPLPVLPTLLSSDSGRKINEPITH